MCHISRHLSNFVRFFFVLLVGCTLLGAQEVHTRAWTILQTGVEGKSAETRGHAVLALGLIPGNPKAVELAEHALQDSKPEVRRAAVAALGEMNSEASLPKIKTLLEDPKSSDVKTVIAIAAVLKQFDDPLGYKIYSEIVSGQRNCASLLDGLKDKKALETMAFEEALGFIPFASYGVAAYRYFKQHDTANANVHAAAASALTGADPTSEAILVDASLEGKEVVRVAALRALAKRSNAAVIEQIDSAMYSKKARVRYAAAAAVIHLSDLRSHDRHTTIDEHANPIPIELDKK
jgi:HEAT repeat protein